MAAAGQLADELWIARLHSFRSARSHLRHGRIAHRAIVTLSDAYARPKPRALPPLRALWNAEATEPAAAHNWLIFACWADSGYLSSDVRADDLFRQSGNGFLPRR